jgi:hypothetical protein
MIFLQGILFFFINSFLSFPLHLKRIILCFVYSDDNNPSFIYPSLEKEYLPYVYVVVVDLVSSLHPIHKDELCIETPLKFDHPCILEEVETNSKPSLISAPHVVTFEPCHYLVKTHIQLTIFQAKIRDKIFKPLRLPYHLHPYPLDFIEYLPHFFGEDHVTTKRHLEAFENFIDQFEIVHDDVIMRLLFKYLIREVVVCFTCLGAGSIGYWIKLCHAFLKCWGENKSLYQY